jgi:hypothetical protein
MQWTDYLKKQVKALITVPRRWLHRAVRRISDVLALSSIRFRMGAFRGSRLFPVSVRNGLGQVLGDMGRLTGDLLEKPVWRATDSNLEIFFVGSQKGCKDVLPLFFFGNASYEQIGSVSAFTVTRKMEQWLQGGADLVVAELSRIHPFRPKAPIVFAVPHWVSQIIEYPEHMDTLLAGNRYNNLRRNINKSRKAGCEWRFSRSREDFDYFYKYLYRPFIQSRHKDSAHIAPYPLQWDFWIDKAQGGLVMVTQAGETVAGAICLVKDEVCYNIEIGVLDPHETRMQQGINAFLFWSVAEWGKQQGAKFYNMGGSFGWRADGTFRWKRKWGSRVISDKKPNHLFVFGANRFSPELMEKVNSIGFVCETRDRSISSREWPRGVSRGVRDPSAGEVGYSRLFRRWQPCRNSLAYLTVHVSLGVPFTLDQAYPFVRRRNGRAWVSRIFCSGPRTLRSHA